MAVALGVLGDEGEDDGDGELGGPAAVASESADDGADAEAAAQTPHAEAATSSVSARSSATRSRCIFIFEERPCTRIQSVVRRGGVRANTHHSEAERAEWQRDREGQTRPEVAARRPAGCDCADSPSSPGSDRRPFLCPAMQLCDVLCYSLRADLLCAAAG